MFFAAETFVVQPNLWLLGLSIALFVVALAFATVTGAKGRWPWFVVGFFLPIAWVIGAFLPARPDSPWEQRQRRRAELRLRRQRRADALPG